MGNPLTGGQIFGGSRLRETMPPSIPVPGSAGGGIIEDILKAGGGGLPTTPTPSIPDLVNGPMAGENLISDIVNASPGGTNISPTENKPVPVPKLPSGPIYAGGEKPTNISPGPIVPPTPQPVTPTTITPTVAPTTIQPQPQLQPQVMKSPRRKAGPKRPQTGATGRIGTRPISMY